MNKKEEFGCQKNNQRMSFTKEFKRKALVEFSKGKKAQEVLLDATNDILKIDTTDKKYYAKIMHKWRKELYLNNSMLAFTSIKPSDENLDIEINNIGTDFEEDDIEEEFGSNDDMV